MTWVFFFAAALVIVVAGGRLARFGDVIGEKTGMGGSWVGAILLAATTSLPELFTGFGSTAIAPLPNIAVGDVLGSCMFNLLILSMMDAIQPEPLGARAHQGHALAIGFGILLISIAGFGLAVSSRVPSVLGIGAITPILIGTYLLSMRTLFRFEKQRIAREAREVARELRYEKVSLRSAIVQYAAAAVVVVAAALWLPTLGAQIARETGLGEAFVGSFFIALATSLPEIVVSFAAVRMGAIDLGVGNVLGSNLFNLFVLGLDDIFYRPGVLLEAADSSHVVSIFAVGAMYAFFLLGITIRAVTKRFIVSWDTAAIAAVYALAIGFTFFGHG
jgi:cation:H+ antiporter